MKSILGHVSALAGLALLISIFAQPAQAVVQVTGNVLLSPDAGTGTYTGLYADNPFSTTVNEGIPTNGNRIDPFRGQYRFSQFRLRRQSTNRIRRPPRSQWCRHR